MKRIAIPQPIKVINFGKRSVQDQNGNDSYLVGLEQDLTEIHSQLPKDTNNVVFSLRQLETLANTNNMSVNAAFALLRLAGNTAMVSVEERVVGEPILDDDNNPVLDATGAPRVYLGPLSGELAEGDKYAVISIDFIEFGQTALNKHTDIILQAELQQIANTNADYAFPVRKANRRQLGEQSDPTNDGSGGGGATTFQFRARKGNESANAYNAAKAAAQEEFDAAHAGG